MAFLNPSAEPFQFPSTNHHTLAPASATPTVATRSDTDTAESVGELYALLFPGHRLVHVTSGCKVFKPSDPKAISYVVLQSNDNEESRMRLRHEVAMLKKLQIASGKTHPAIRNLLKCIDLPSYPPIKILEDDGKPLYNYQKHFEDGILPEILVKDLMRQLLTGLEWIHSKDIVVREITAKRLIISRDQFPSLRISDFGRACHVSDIDERYMHGVQAYRPPDVHLGVISYGTEYDVWSAGCIYAEMMSGEQLFPYFRGPSNHIRHMIHVLDFRGTQAEIAKRHQLVRLPWEADDATWPWHAPLGYATILGNHWSPMSASFINSFIQFDPTARTTASDALKSPYLRTEPLKIARPPTPPSPTKIDEAEAEINEVLQQIMTLEIGNDGSDITPEAIKFIEEPEAEVETLESLLGL